MTIETQLSEREFIQVSLALMYSRPATKSIAVVAFVFLAIAISGFISSPHSANPLSLLVPLAMLTALPLSIYLSSKKAFRNTPQLQEKVKYQITNTGVEVKGETYSVAYLWSEIDKVSQQRNWLFIWQGKQRALPISAKNLQNGQVAEMKEILADHGIKNNLK